MSRKLTVRFFIKTDAGTVSLDEAAEEQTAALAEKVLQSIGRVMTE